MTRIITIFGIVSGLVLGLFLASMVVTVKSGDQKSMFSGMVFGYAMMLLAFSVIFVAVKNYRDKYLDGSIGFGKAFGIGMGITLIASVLYTITWLILLETVVPDFMDKYIAMQLEELRKAGKPAQEIQQHAAEMEGYRKMYNTWYGRALMTFIEPLPVGIFISLIAGLVMKRKPKRMQMA